MLRGYIKYLFFFSLLILLGCSKFIKKTRRIPVVEVNGEILYQNELDKVIPKNINKIDSANIADRYIKKWATTALMYHNAKKNIVNEKEINNLVEEYKQSLTIHEYEQAIVSERVDTNLTKEEIKTFYEMFKSKLILEEHIIKGILLITPKETPNIEKVRSWIKKGDTESIEKIEKYSLKNAVSFDYFMDRWTPFSEFLEKIPFKTTDFNSFIKKNRFVERSDSTKHYFLKITDAKVKGEITPFENAKKKIAYIILNKKKKDFIINFESSIYKDAIKSGKIKFLLKED